MNTELTALTLPQLLDEEIAIVKVSGPTCKPCKDMEPVLQKALEKNPMPRYDLCAALNRDLAFELDVRSVPTFILYKKGKPVSTLVGSHSEIGDDFFGK